MFDFQVTQRVVNLVRLSRLVDNIADSSLFTALDYGTHDATNARL